MSEGYCREASLLRSGSCSNLYNIEGLVIPSEIQRPFGLPETADCHDRSWRLPGATSQYPQYQRAHRMNVGNDPLRVSG